MFIPLYGLPVALLSGMTPPLFWFFQGWVQGIAPASSSAMMRLVTVSYMPKDICSSSLPKAGKASVGEGDGYLKYITVKTAPLLAGLSSGFHHPEFFELGVGEGALFLLDTMRTLVVRRYGFEVTIPAFVS